MLVVESETTIDVSFSHPLNASYPMDVTFESSRLILFNAVQSLKTYIPISRVSAVLGANTTLSSLSHSLNALVSIIVTLAGIVMLVISVP